MKNWWTLALGVVFGILSAGVLYLASQPPRGNAIGLLPPPTPIPIQVHISGEVQNPGVYAISPGRRLQDVIEVAGGFTIKADSTSLNLASLLEDGIRVQVPAQPQVETPSLEKAASSEPENLPSNSTSPPADNSSAKLVNINNANQERLETLSGIGPATAQKIIAFREENGSFTSIEEIQKVSGIGPVTFENIKDFITVDE